MSYQQSPQGYSQPLQPSQPLYPQQPMYQTPPPQMQPSFPQPPKRRSKTWLWIIALFVVFFIGMAVGSGMHSNASTTTTATNTTTTQSGSTVAPTQSTSGGSTTHHKVGETVSVDSTWDVTVTGIKTSAGDDITSPKAGKTYLLVAVSMKNISSNQQAASTLIQYSLRDTTGQKYDETIVDGVTGPDGNVAAGDPLKGTLAFEVPTKTKAFVLDFISTIGGQQVSWDITA